jgi:hypothetical protein
MAAGVAQHLPRFAASEPDVFAGASWIAPLGAARPQKLAEQIAEAEERGRCQGREAAMAELDRIRGEDRRAFELEFAESRRLQLSAIADRLEECLAAELAAIAARITDNVGRALAPFLISTVRERACDEIAETTLALLHSGDHVSIKVSGPADLINRLSARIAGHPHALEVADSEPEVQVTIDDTTIATRIAAWSDRLTAVVAETPNG